MARFIQTNLEDKIADLLVYDRSFKIYGILLSIENDEIKITIQKEEE
jgi:hypothetical protein